MKLQKKIFNTRKITITAMLAAVSTVLMFLSFNFPLMPSFIKMDFSELPALIAAFALGPVSGVMVCFIKNIINLMFSTTSGVGELCNFMLGAMFVLPAGMIYKKHKSHKGAIVGAFIGAVCMALSSVITNYFITYPAYSLFMPIDAILAMYQAILPSVDSLLKALLVFNMPFTFVKGILSAIITFFIYKPLSPIIKGRKI